jgi:hypothetical protein
MYIYSNELSNQLKVLLDGLQSNEEFSHVFLCVATSPEVNQTFMFLEIKEWIVTFWEV